MRTCDLRVQVKCKKKYGSARTVHNYSSDDPRVPIKTELYFGLEGCLANKILKCLSTNFL